MELPAALYDPTELAFVVWRMIAPAALFGIISFGASLLGRVCERQSVSKRVPTFARVFPLVGATMAGLPALAWGINATVDLVLWCEVVFAGHGDLELFPAFFLVVPISGFVAIAIDWVCCTMSNPRVQIGRLRYATILAAVNGCWAFVVVLLVFRWDA